MQNHKTNSMLKLVVTAILSIMLLFGFVMPSSMVLANIAKYGIATVKAESENELQVSGLKTSYKLGENMTIPAVSGATVKVYDPQNKEVYSGDISSVQTIKAELAGDYSVYYSKNDGHTTTGEILINVKATTPTFNFNTNSQYIIPKTIALENGEKVVTFPTPEIKDEDGEIIEGAKANITIRRAGDSSVKTVDETNAYTFNQEGTYSVTYSYGGSDLGMNKITKQYSIVVDNKFVPNVSLTYSLDGTFPTSMIQGVEVEFPKAIGKDANNNNVTVDVYTVITVEYIDADGNITPTIVKDFKFTPTKAGKYRVKYTVTDAYGTKSEEGSYKNIDNVYDSQVPTIKVVEDYEVKEDGTLTNETIERLKQDESDHSSKIPSIAGLNKEVVLPAIYATDNVSEYKNINMRRLIKNSSGTIINIDDASSATSDNDMIEIISAGSKNTSAKVKFKSTGKYTIIYKATDEASKVTNDSLYSYSIVIEEAVNDTIAPTITVKDFVKNKNGNTIEEVEAGQKIRIMKPNVVDYFDPTDASNKDVVDTRPTLKVIAKVGTEEKELKLNKEGTYYEYQVPENPTDNKVIITYIAQDCNGNIGNGSDSNGLIKTINIINANDDYVPVLTGTPTTVLSGDQYEQIDLMGSGITVSDLKDRNVLLDIQVIHEDGERIDLDKFKTIRTKTGDGSTLTVNEAKFTANRAGKYYVNYVAYDHSGNYTVKSTSITIASVAVPVISVEDYSTEMQLGSAYIPQAKIYLDGVIDEGATISTIVEGDINKLGKVTVTYKGTASNYKEASDVTITFTVKDTIAPKLTLADEVPLYADLIEETVGGVTQYKEITLPGFTATDEGAGVDKDKFSIEVKGKNGEKIADIKGKASGISFRPTRAGKYTVVYSATDKAGNVQSETYTIAVGDVEKPVITIKEDSEPVTKATLKNGSYTLKINKSDITVTDNDGKTPTLTIKVEDSTGKEINAEEGTEYVYNLTEAGKYKISIIAKDSADNEQIKVYTLDLSAETNTSSTTTEVLGTILLVLSILVLAGVVWYFVKPAPKSSKDKKKVNKQSNDEM